MQLPPRWQYLADYLKSQLDLVDARGSPSESYFRDLVFASRQRLVQKHDMWRFMNRDFLSVSLLCVLRHPPLTGRYASVQATGLSFAPIYQITTVPPRWMFLKQ
jgi:hypothetical protein